MNKKISKIIEELLMEIPETEEVNPATLQKAVEEVREILNLGAVSILSLVDENRDYLYRWVAIENENWKPEKDVIRIRTKEYNYILENCLKEPVFCTMFSEKAKDEPMALLGYGFVRNATTVIDGALVFATYPDHEWTDEEKECLIKLGRTLKRVLSCEMLRETDIQLKMARTKVEIYRHYTEYDSLTQVPNRNFFVRFCKEYVEKSKRPNVGFLFADLNRLKFINDKMGHPEGDIYITNFAEKLNNCFANGIVCRISGDEFIACTIKDTKEEFEKKVEALKIQNIYRGVPQAAIGYIWHDEAENIKDIMNEAEANMYKDKKKFYSEYPEYKR